MYKEKAGTQQLQWQKGNSAQRGVAFRRQRMCTRGVPPLLLPTGARGQHLSSVISRLDMECHFPPDGRQTRRPVPTLSDPLTWPRQIKDELLNCGLVTINSMKKPSFMHSHQGMHSVVRQSVGCKESGGMHAYPWRRANRNGN